MEFGKEYIIPTPFDPRLISVVSIAVAKAAIESGVAKKPITDWAKYEEELKQRGARIIWAGDAWSHDGVGCLSIKATWNKTFY